MLFASHTQSRPKHCMLGLDRDLVLQITVSSGMDLLQQVFIECLLYTDYQITNNIYTLIPRASSFYF